MQCPRGLPLGVDEPNIGAVHSHVSATVGDFDNVHTLVEKCTSFLDCMRQCRRCADAGRYPRIVMHVPYHHLFRVEVPSPFLASESAQTKTFASPL